MNGPDNAEDKPPESTIGGNMGQGKGSMPPQLQNAERATTIETNAIVKNIGNTTSRQKAINAMCFHCFGCTEDEYITGVRQDIKNCTATKCPLYNFRPYREKGNDDQDMQS